MDGTQQLVAVGGLGLAAVNFWTSNQRPLITGVLWGDAGADAAAGHKALLGLGGELLLIAILTLVAGQSDGMATGMLAAVAALWVLWGIHHYTGVTATPAPAPARTTTLA